MIKPPSLIKGDKIGLVAPARKIAPGEISKAIDIIESQGFVPVYRNDLFAADNQFAGNDLIRASNTQQMLDDPEIKAIFCARGGYGSVRIIDMLNFELFKKHPKWFVGYSDVTVFHSHINTVLGVQTLHATMPINFPENTGRALSGLFDVLRGTFPGYTIEPHHLNRKGNTEGILTGGNLSVLYSLMGSRSFPDMKDKLLFIEDLDEYLYHIDRMMLGLKRAGLLEKLNGLIIGGMTDMNDNEVPFGKTAYEIIQEAVAAYNYPVCFGFPAGHFNNNRPLIMGAQVKLDVNDHPQITFLD
ncbi:MAG: LD-carboxypeptidase [Bacteroidales bacterium]|jgi:muramoyltetrapeptide carboxypeptidase|nr:LD-carboxypeptidase [Bacteroidales bacterium]